MNFFCDMLYLPFLIAPLHRNAVAVPRAIVPRFYSVESPSRPQFATTSPTTGAPVMPINSVRATVAPPPPAQTSGIPPITPPINSSSGGSSGGGKKKKKGFFRRVKQVFGYGSVALLTSGGYCE